MRKNEYLCIVKLKEMPNNQKANVMKKIKNKSRELYSQCSDLYREMVDNLEDVLKQLPERKLEFTDDIDMVFAYVVNEDGDIEERLIENVWLDEDNLIFVHIQGLGDEYLTGGQLLCVYTLMNINAVLDDALRVHFSNEK